MEHTTAFEYKNQQVLGLFVGTVSTGTRRTGKLLFVRHWCLRGLANAILRGGTRKTAILRGHNTPSTAHTVHTSTVDM